jgi:hypothetical protein
MAKTTTAKKYEWDIAISLCNEDIDFAKKLVKAINPTLKVFFYEDRQQELISKSGPEVFAKTFKDESRVIVILSRKEWSESFYTEIERNAIVDRTKSEGYQSIMVIPMVQGETPPWYPSTQIYASHFRFSIEELAHFIEFKVTEKGGVVKSLTLEDRYQNLLDRIEEKKKTIFLQQDKVAIQSARDEMNNFKDCFNSKSDFLKKSKSIIDKVFSSPFSEHVKGSHFGYGDYLLECQFALPDEMYNRIVTTQDFCVTFELFKTFGNAETKKTLAVEQRVFYYTPELQGWALPHLFEQATNTELQVLFQNRDNSKFYDLTNPLRTSSLVDHWFQLLLSKSTETIERFI